MSVPKRTDPDALKGTFKKDGRRWQIEIPEVGCRAEATSVVKCFADVEKFMQELYEDDEINIHLQVDDGGTLRVITGPDRS